jgi:hypothetical protein
MNNKRKMKIKKKKRRMKIVKRHCIGVTGDTDLRGSSFSPSWWVEVSS